MTITRIKGKKNQVENNLTRQEIRRELMIWTFSIHGISGGKGDTASKPGQGIQLVTMFSPTLATPLTVACQTPLSVGFPRQEYWRGLPFPSPGHLPDPGIKPRSPAYLPEMLLFFLLLRVLFSSILCWGGFPDGPVVKIPRFQCRGCGFWSGNWDPACREVWPES